MKGRRSRQELLQTRDSEPMLEPLSPTGGPLTPEPRKPPHAAGCFCTDCWQAGLEMGEYLQKKRLFDENGF